MEKPGYKTTEFWLSALTAVAALVNGSGVLKFQIPLDVVGQAVMAVMTYVGSRSVVKAVAAAASYKAQAPKSSDLNK